MLFVFTYSSDVYVFQSRYKRENSILNSLFVLTTSDGFSQNAKYQNTPATIILTT